MFDTQFVLILTMKKPFLIIIAIICLLTSCKLDEAGFNQNSLKTSNFSGTIVGMWYLKSAHSVGTALNIPIDVTDTGTLQDYYLFKSDNTVDVSTADDGITSGTYTYDPSTKKLNVTKDGETEVIVLSALTSDTMVLAFNVSVPALATSLSITATYTR